jgi:hypothetical protein
MDKAWTQQRPHLRTLVQSLDEDLKLADELYEQGRASGEAVDYGAFEERVARATAKVEQDVHQVALSGLNVDVPFIRVWESTTVASTASRERTDRSAGRSSSNARCIARSAGGKVLGSILGFAQGCDYPHCTLLHVYRRSTSSGLLARSIASGLTTPSASDSEVAAALSCAASSPSIKKLSPSLVRADSSRSSPSSSTISRIARMVPAESPRK